MDIIIVSHLSTVLLGHQNFTITYGVPWIITFCHVWGDSPTIITNEAIAGENYWRIASRVAKQI